MQWILVGQASIGILCNFVWNYVQIPEEAEQQNALHLLKLNKVY